MTPDSQKRRRCHHHHHSRISSSVIFVSSSTLLLGSIDGTSNAWGSSSLPLRVGAFSFSSHPLSNFSVLRKNNMLRYPRGSFSPRRRRTTIIPVAVSSSLSSSSSSSSSEFPQQDYYDDSNIDWDDNAIIPQRNSVFQRLGVIPDSRREGLMTSNKDRMFQNDDDEWESYLNMDVIMDGVEDDMSVSSSNGEINNRISRQVLVETRKDAMLMKGSRARRSLSKSTDTRKKSGMSVPDNDEAITHVIDSNTPSKPSLSVVGMSRNKSNPDDSPGSHQQQSEPKSQSTHRRITTDQINLVKSSVSLVDVIESYNLPHFTRSSNSHSQSTATAKVCCPFHDDHNPSMSIDNSRGLYKCFVCGAGGDVFNFIREYDYLEKAKRGQEKMKYMQAVEYVAREFGDKNLVSDWNFVSGSRDGTYEDMSDEAKENIRKREWKKERIRQANTAAAAFYTKCLITLPSAGKARVHLRSRNLTPATIRTFSLGYAPDCYYGDEAKMAKTTTKKGSWGAGSLVEFLVQAGFSPDEIVEAGLAVRTKRRQLALSDESNEIVEPSDEIESGAEGEQQRDYSCLMDRFRSRLIIPIFDESGQSVIALGGRHLDGTSDESDEEASSYKPAKYLNSPDSLVFTKKNVLFNKARAKRVLEDLSRKSSAAAENNTLSATNSSTFDVPPAVIIVEGYFDAIALSNVGVENVVASMGTALPFEQLKAAAEMGNIPGSRIIFCMDGDDAGINAVERLCGSNILWKVPELNRNVLYVATLPGGDIKDPADFVNSIGGDEKASERFQNEVLDKSMPWDEWYVARLLSKYDADAKDGTVGSFSEISNQISTFLASFPSPADRTRRVHKIAELLVTLIAEQDSSSSSISMLRIQLEADLLNMASRKAGVREAMERRIEQTDGLMGTATTSKMERLSSGDYDAMNDDEKKMSKRSLAITKPQRIESPPRRIIPVANARKQRRVQTSTRPIRTNEQQRDMKLRERHLVPHFNGFTFKHQSDNDWLGLSGSANMKRKMYLGEVSTPREENRIRADTPVFEHNSRMNQKRDGVVYFNSNRYLGMSPSDQLTSSSGESIVEVMERKLLNSPDPDHLIMQAECRLLHALAKFPQARMAMRTVYSASTFGPSNLRWSNSDREWLFLCLTGSPDINPLMPLGLLDGGSRLQLHLYLAARDDCPKGAFSHEITKSLDETFSGDGSEVNGSVSEEPIPGRPTGSLDEYFLETDMFPSFTNNTITSETRAELTVQETVATLLRATAMKRFARAKSKLARIVHEMDLRAYNGTKSVNLVASNDLSELTPDELQELFLKVGKDTVEAQRSLYESERSTDRVNSHLLDYSVTSGVQYKLSQAKLDNLDRMMEEFIASLPEDNHRPETPGNDGSYEFGSDQYHDKHDPQYGGKNIEDYVVRGLPNGESKWD